MCVSQLKKLYSQNIADCFRSLAERELGWKADRSIEQMCSDFWRWQMKNPAGYKTVLTNGHSN